MPYLARVEVHQTIGLTSKLVDQQRSQFSLATKVPERRLDLRFGKMGLPDFLDANGPGSDSHLQFMNWTVDNNGAWDYAADTRGYTYAFIAEYDDADWSARYAIALMPTIANGIDLEWNLRRASGQNVELEYRKTPLAFVLPAERKGTVRLLGYVNHANMGDYRVQNLLALAARAKGNPAATPVITAHPFATTVKYGIGLNFEQELTQDLRVFGRFGWNEGQHESYAYTEVDQTFQLGGDQARPPELPRAGRARLFAWRRQAQLRPRGHPGDLLHRPHLARTLHFTRRSADRPSRLQPGARAGSGLQRANACGLLGHIYPLDISHPSPHPFSPKNRSTKDLASVPLPRNRGETTVRQLQNFVSILNPVSSYFAASGRAARRRIHPRSKSIVPRMASQIVVA